MSEHTPMTDAELESLRELLGISTATTADLERLLAEVGWLRAENAALRIEPSTVRWDELLAEKNGLIEEVEGLRAQNGVLVTEVRFQAERAERLRAENAQLAAARSELSDAMTVAYEAMNTLSEKCGEIARERDTLAADRDQSRRIASQAIDNLEKFNAEAKTLHAELASAREFAERAHADRDQYRQWRDEAVDKLTTMQDNDLNAALALADIINAVTADRDDLAAKLDRAHAELERAKDARAAETDEYVRQLRALPGWCRACPPGCSSCLGPDCECYEHDELTAEGQNAMIWDLQTKLGSAQDEAARLRAELATPAEGAATASATAEDADAPHWAHAVLPEEIVRQRAHGWPDFHPEHYCHRCGRRNAIWWVDGDLWQATTAGRRRGILEILCPSCFVDLYEESTGEGRSWRLLPDVASVHEEAASGMPRPPAEEADVHDYLSTACHHGVHDHCRSATSIDGGTKEPGTCKFCDAKCRCDCHPWSAVETTRQRWETATMPRPHQERSVD